MLDSIYIQSRVEVVVTGSNALVGFSYLDRSSHRQFVRRVVLIIAIVIAALMPENAGGATTTASKQIKNARPPATSGFSSILPPTEPRQAVLTNIAGAPTNQTS